MILIISLSFPSADYCMFYNLENKSSKSNLSMKSYAFDFIDAFYSACSGVIVPFEDYFLAIESNFLFSKSYALTVINIISFEKKFFVSWVLLILSNGLTFFIMILLITPSVNLRKLLALISQMDG